MLKAIIVGTLLTMTAAATDYHVGPGQAMTTIGQVPWYALQPGDTVYIHYQPTPYYEKFLISGRGTPTQWIRVLGVPGPNGELPIISGNNAVTSKNNHYHWQDATGGSAIQWDGVVQIAINADSGTLPGYIEVANLQVQDGYQTYSFTAENGTKANYDTFTACIYARSVQHLLVHNNVMTNCALGFYNWTGAGVNWWDGLETDTVLRANYFYNNGLVGSYTEHQSYTESDGVTIEYNRYGPQRSGALGSQLKDRSAGSVIRYNYIEGSPQGWMIDLVEPQESYAAIGQKATYGQDFVYGNVLINKGDVGSMIHWNEDHMMGQGRALVPGGRLTFYDNTVVTVGDQSDTYSFSLFNETWGGYDCPTAKQPGVIDLRNNIFYAANRTAGAALPLLTIAYCGFENFNFGKNWISPGWGINGGTLTGNANLFVPTVNDPGFTNLAANDVHLNPGSSAIGIGQALPALVTTNAIGTDQTPTLQYVYHTQVTARPSNGGAGSDLGAFDSGAPVGCTYAVSPASNSFASAAATGSFSVTTGSTCGWSASTSTAWITITSGSSGTGYGLVNYSVAANTSTSSRSGSLTVAGTSVPVTQAGVSCSYSLSATSNSLAAAGGTGSVSVTGTTGCSWTAVSNNTSWITINSGASGSGNGTVGYTVAANTATTARTGTVTIAGQTYTVSQAAAAPTCSYSISAASASVAAAGGTGSVNVTAGTGCTWTAASNATWITVTSGASGSGNGATGYSAAANTATTARTGTVTIAGQTFTVSQAAAAPTCTYSISATGASATAAGGTGSVNVTAGTGCTWTAASNATWITLTSGASGSGNGATGYSVAANTATTARTGSVTIAGQTFTVSQDAAVVVPATCAYTVAPMSVSAPNSGGTATLTVTAPAGCAWTVAPGASWVTVNSGASGTGNGTIVLNVAANVGGSSIYGATTIAGTTRTASVTAATNTVMVTQGATTTGSTTTVQFKQGVNSYAGTADRNISSMYATESWNGGVGVTDPAGTGTLEFKNDSDYEARTLMRFTGLNLPTGATIVSATLTMTFTNWLSTPEIVSGQYLTTAWNATAAQAGLNWKNRDTSLVWSAPGAKGVGTDVMANDTFTFAQLNANGKQTVTTALDPAVVQGWVNNPATNQGFVLVLNSQSTPGNVTAFSSEGAAASRPILTITYR